MIRKIIECVPNVSEGQNTVVIGEIVNAVRTTQGCAVLHVDSDYSSNRTVITFVGDEQAVLEGGYALFKKANELIDMSKHQGAHPRLGAVDVFPFIPLQGVTMAECVTLSKMLAEKVAEELAIPVYLYGRAARMKERESLSVIRSGEYEGLKSKLASPQWSPDYGKPLFNKKFGAAVIGARPILIAYNVNLDTHNPVIAQTIAQKMRAIRNEKSGKAQILNSQRQGFEVTISSCQAIGWLLEKDSLVQVSTNILDYKTTPLHHVYEFCAWEAKNLNANVVGSEIVGLVPQAALVQAGEYYMDDTAHHSDDEFMSRAEYKLGLSSFKPFRRNEKVIELALKRALKGKQ